MSLNNNSKTRNSKNATLNSDISNLTEDSNEEVSNIAKFK